MKIVHTITKDDVGKRIIKRQCQTCGAKRPLNVHGLMGTIQSIDVGKRISKSKFGPLYVENQEQLEARTQQIIG